MQATLRSPLWVFLGSFLVCQRLVTPARGRGWWLRGQSGLHPLQVAFQSHQPHPTLPLTPRPLVTAMTSMTSLWLNTLYTGTCFSSRAWAQATFSATVPPFNWISMMCAFFCRKGSSFICRTWHSQLVPGPTCCYSVASWGRQQTFHALVCFMGYVLC